ncbi:MAG: glycoside hydrolase family 99-like domain-containing protein [Armatimonadetes bacterium]|jgi:hypothetical protein|nr:glycoside hydrolase family 99-like domain-containing protein [Armatimonadota bacterium]MDI9601172.1 glycoside hydrolase family 99-like domain-containing protein [Acidobacteriota bacterium]
MRLVLTLCLTGLAAGTALGQEPAVRIRDFLCTTPPVRAGAELPIWAVVANPSEEALEIEVALSVPQGVTLVEGEAAASLTLGPLEEADLRWVVTAGEEVRADLRLDASSDGETASRVLPIRFFPTVPAPPDGYVPPPNPADSPLLVGAHHCPLWEADSDSFGRWDQIRRDMSRYPALGFYDAVTPEVADWETKWAVEHGIDFFIYCWYRVSQGGPVETMLEGAITEGFLKSEYQDQMKFTIMWENQRKGVSGVADHADLMENLLPYWMETFFKHPSYLVVDNRPVLFIYRPEYLVDDLGSVEAVREAFGDMAEACRAEGFDGITLLGEYRGTNPTHLTLMRDLGLDYTFAYVWYVHDSPEPQRAIDTQFDYLEQTEEMGIIPQVATLSQGWSGWNNEGSIWQIPPQDFVQLLERGVEFVGTLDQDSLSGRMLLLDNWNEWGEGHYIAPYVGYGFGYLDAVRQVLTDAPVEHTDYLPSDVGMGPYDAAYWEWIQRETALGRLGREEAHKPGGDEAGLIGWWAFDEDPDAQVALDYTGRRHGAVMFEATRAPGIDGNALVCDGGAAVVPSSDYLNPGDGVSIECWVRTDVADQGNTWVVNRVYHEGDAGYRLGVVRGAPCFHVPETSWSHHLHGPDPLPVGRWVHLAGTFDGQVMRLYVDGAEVASMERAGPVKPNDYPLTLGSYEAGHAAHFIGLLDEVKVYSRALTAEEIAARAARL